MSIFDTIIFHHPIPCARCGVEIRSDQTKAFECTLDEYRVDDTFGSARAGEASSATSSRRCEACRAFATRCH